MATMLALMAEPMELVVMVEPMAMGLGEMAELVEQVLKAELEGLAWMATANGSLSVDFEQLVFEVSLQRSFFVP